MKKNMATLDRTIRLLIVAVIAVLYFTHRISGTLALVLEIVAIVFLLTSLIGWCPVYTLLGFSTRKDTAPPAAA